jgi:hypothetical protein
LTGTRISERFGLHRKKVKGKSACVVMAVIGTFYEEDITDQLARYQVSSEVLALLYENLVTLRVRESHLPEYNDNAIAGGGRVGSNDVGLVYVCSLIRTNKRC